MKLLRCRGTLLLALAVLITAGLIALPTAQAQLTPAFDIQRHHGLFLQVWPTDLNNDGRTDLVASDSDHGRWSATPGRVAVALGNGDGTFGPLVVSNFAGQVLGTADFNGDGRRDVIAGQHDGTPMHVVILPGNGDGTLQEPQVVDNVPGWTFALAHDFDGDGRRDLAIGSEPQFLMVYPGHGDFTFGPPQQIITDYLPRRGIVADFDGDGRRDIAVANEYGFSVTVALNRGATTFSVADIPFPEEVRGITAADADGDGRVDLFAASSGHGQGGIGYEDGHVTVLRGNGDGTFAAQDVYDVARGASEIVVGDFTGDGRLDLVTSNKSATYVDDCAGSLKGWDSISILPGNGDGTFHTASSFALGDQRNPADSRFINTANSLTTNDFNRDGRTDLLAANGALILTQPPAFNRPPTVYAGPDAEFLFTGETVLTPSASDPDNHLLHFQWSRSTGDPLQVVPNPCIFLAPGDTTLTVTVDDGHGGVASDSVTYRLVTPETNEDPVVSLTSPVDGAEFAGPASIELSADAVDADGHIVSVVFIANSQFIAEDNSAPYSVTWRDVPPGTYTIYARALDNHAEETTSAPITVRVQRRAGGDALLTDDFNDDAIDSTKWVTANLFTGTEDPAIPVRETGGTLRIGPLLSGAAGSHYNGIASIRSYDFRGAYASVQLTSPTQPGSQGFAMFAVGVNSSNYYRFYYSGGNVVAERRIAGSKTTLHSEAFESARHSFFRIRHDQATGQAVFETAGSAAPGVWEQFASVVWHTGYVSLTAVKFELKAGTSDSGGAASGIVGFDTFEAAPFVSSPDAALLSDDFSSPDLDVTKWARAVLSGSQSAGLPVSVAEGRLWIGPFASGSGYNGILSTSRYDFTNASARVQLARPFSDALIMLTLPIDSANHYRIYRDSAGLHFEEKLANAKRILASVPFDSTAHGFWRVRHSSDDDTIAFETAAAPGGVPGPWTTHASIPRRLPVTAVKFELKAGTNGAVADPAAVAFDNFKAER